MAELRASRCCEGRIEGQNATGVQFCELRLPIKCQHVSHRLSGKIDAPRIVTRVVVFTGVGDKRHIVSRTLIMSVPMTIV